MRSYLPPVAIGEKMRGGAVCRVLASKSSKVKENDLVSSMCGWTEVAIVNEKQFEPLDLPKNAKVTDAIGCLGKFPLSTPELRAFPVPIPSSPAEGRVAG